MKAYNQTHIVVHKFWICSCLIQGKSPSYSTKWGECSERGIQPIKVYFKTNTKYRWRNIWKLTFQNIRSLGQILVFITIRLTYLNNTGRVEAKRLVKVVYNYYLDSTSDVLFILMTPLNFLLGNYFFSFENKCFE